MKFIKENLGKIAYLAFVIIVVLLGMSSCHHERQSEEIPYQDELGRTNSEHLGERVFQIEVIDVATGDTIVLQYTTNSARYTEAYKKQ